MLRLCDNKTLDPNDDELSQRRGGQVALGPRNNPIIQKIAELITNTYGYTIWYFDTPSDIKTAVKANDYGGIDPATGRKKAICVGVMFSNMDQVNAQYSYSLHYNLSGPASADDIRDSIDDQIIPYQEEDDADRDQISSGLPLLINFIDELILQDATANTNAKLESLILRVPTPGYKKSNLFTNTNGQLSIYILFPLCVIYLRLVYKILFEKEYRIQQNLRNMGMNMYSHYFSWVLFYMTILFVISIIWTLIVWGIVFRNISIFIVWSLFFLPGLFFICLGFFITSFFQRAKPGVLAALLIFFFFYFGVVGLIVTDEPSQNFLLLISLSPLGALERIGYILLLLQSNYTDFNLGMVNDLVANYRLSIFFASCLGNSLLWLLLALWIDQVWPGETGVARHPCFCFGCRTKGEKVHQKYKLQQKVTIQKKFTLFAVLNFFHFFTF